MEQQHMEHMGKVFPNHPEDPWVKFPHVAEDGQMHIYYVDTRNGKSTWEHPPTPTYLPPTAIIDRFIVPSIEATCYYNVLNKIKGHHNWGNDDVALLKSCFETYKIFYNEDQMQMTEGRICDILEQLQNQINNLEVLSQRPVWDANVVVNAVGKIGGKFKSRRCKKIYRKKRSSIRRKKRNHH
ncbi:MAG: hypothetical protein EBS98_11325 [Chitinophagia bacterium]|nr:hypothetical protein [Chitinophagia bacterium]